MPGDRSPSLPIAALINRLQERGTRRRTSSPGLVIDRADRGAHIGAPIFTTQPLLGGVGFSLHVPAPTPQQAETDKSRTKERQGGRLGYLSRRRNLHYLDVSGHGFHRDASTAPRGGIPYALVREPWHRRKSGCLAASVCERIAQLRERAAYGRLNKEVEGFTALYGADDGIRDDCAPGADENQ